MREEKETCDRNTEINHSRMGERQYAERSNELTEKPVPEWTWVDDMKSVHLSRRMVEKFRMKIVGYCSLERDKILKTFLKDGPRSLLVLDGDHVIIFESDLECYIISSTYCITPYYYTIYEGNLFHSDTVIEILKRSHMPWSWNWKALANIVLLDHVLENETLHTRIHRVPNATIMHFKEGKVEAFTLSWEEMHGSFNGDPQEALRALNEDIRRWTTKTVVVALSGGFDSRLVLSSLLKQGFRPTLVSMGGDDCQDVIIPRMIASILGLKHIRVELDLEDYLTYGKQIAYLTNGTKIAWHWHSYLLPLNLNVSTEVPYFVGSNGGAAKTVEDIGVISLIKDLFPSSFSLRYFWREAMKINMFREGELAEMNREFSAEFSRTKQEERICRLVRLCHKQFLSGLDRFRIEQRERNFHGMGMKLSSASVSLRAPFYARGWVGSVWKLGRLWKLGLRWHRWAIARNYPHLLNFPVNDEKKMCRRPPFSYWLRTGVDIRMTIKRLLHAEKFMPPLSRGEGRKPYAPYGEWFRSPCILGFIVENAGLVSDVVQRDALNSIITEQRSRGGRTAAIAFLLNLIFWNINVKELYAATSTN